MTQEQIDKLRATAVTEAQLAYYIDIADLIPWDELLSLLDDLAAAQARIAELELRDDRVEFWESEYVNGVELLRQVQARNVQLEAALTRLADSLDGRDHEPFAGREVNAVFTDALRAALDALNDPVAPDSSEVQHA